MRKIILLILSAFFLHPISAQFDVMKYGAKGDGSVQDTRSIQEAIDMAFQNGGGIVDVPAGTYKVGTLILKDNINLHLNPGAVILGSPDIRDYSEVPQKFESRPFPLYAKYFVIFAEGVKNISITGGGTIHGNGLKNFQ